MFFHALNNVRPNYFQVVGVDINLLMRIFTNGKDVNVTIAIND